MAEICTEQAAALAEPAAGVAGPAGAGRPVRGHEAVSD
jgi:hypothetical protein